MANKFKLAKATLIIAFLPVEVFVIKNSRVSRNFVFYKVFSRFIFPRTVFAEGAETLLLWFLRQQWPLLNKGWQMRHVMKKAFFKRMCKRQTSQPWRSSKKLSTALWQCCQLIEQNWSFRHHSVSKNCNLRVTFQFFSYFQSWQHCLK